MNMNKNDDWTVSKITGEIKIRGGSLRSLSRANNLKPDTLRNALYRHCPKYEKIIAKYLNEPVEKIWASRYKNKSQGSIMSDKITFVAYAKIGNEKNEIKIEVDRAEYDAIEDKGSYEQELLQSSIGDLVDVGLYIED